LRSKDVTDPIRDPNIENINRNNANMALTGNSTRVGV
jgi:hypothetical protein